MKKVDCIFTGDWHLREDTPIARTDESYWNVQWDKVRYIAELQKKYKCPVLHSGDLFHRWKPSPNLISMTINNLPDQFYTVYGNHDLPQHNLELAHLSGIYALESAGTLEVLGGTHWLKEPAFPSFRIKDKNILVWHVMTYKGKKLPYPGCEDANAKQLLKKYPMYDVILTGHFHITVEDEYKGRLLLNAGSLMRMNADQIKHKPMVFLYHAKTNTVTPHYIPIKKGVVSREHLDIKKERDDRINAFVSGLDTDYGTVLSLEDNIEKFLSKNKIKKGVTNIINESLEN